MKACLIFLFPFALWGATPKDLVEQVLSPDVVLGNAEALGLTNEQQQQLQEAIAPLQRAMWPAQQHMRARNDELVELLAAPKPDEAAVLAKFAELESAEAKVKALRLRMTLAAKAVLSAEQQAKAASLRDGGSAGVPKYGDGKLITEKLQRVRDGIARMQREGRDVEQVRALWDEFQKRAELRHHQLALKALNEALRIVETPQDSPR
jgi:hypothetical protein